MAIIDISLGIHKEMLLYPGDPRVKFSRIQDMLKGDLFNLSKIEMGVHTGTHVDVPLHFIKEGLSITDIPLNKFYRNCSVIDLTDINLGEVIKKSHLKKNDINVDEIILFKTKNSTIYQREFRKDFVYLSQEAAEYLTSIAVKAIGIDYLSIEQFEINDSETHKILLSHGIIVFEGLSLAHVDPGKYLFIGFPIKLMNCEGAPVRAILIS